MQFVRAVMGRWPKAVLQFEVTSCAQLERTATSQHIAYRHTSSSRTATVHTATLPRRTST